MTRPGADQYKQPHPESILGRLAALGDVLKRLDGIDPDTDSIAYDTATDHLIGATRGAAGAARLLIEDAALLMAALTDAEESHRDLTGFCRDCDEAYDGLCGDHEQWLAQADDYQTLRQALTDPVNTGP